MGWSKKRDRHEANFGKIDTSLRKRKRNEETEYRFYWIPTKMIQKKRRQKEKKRNKEKLFTWHL